MPFTTETPQIVVGADAQSYELQDRIIVVTPVKSSFQGGSFVQTPATLRTFDKDGDLIAGPINLELESNEAGFWHIRDDGNGAFTLFHSNGGAGTTSSFDASLNQTVGVYELQTQVVEIVPGFFAPLLLWDSLIDAVDLADGGIAGIASKTTGGYQYVAFDANNDVETIVDIAFSATGTGLPIDRVERSGDKIIIMRQIIDAVPGTNIEDRDIYAMILNIDGTTAVAEFKVSEGDHQQGGFGFNSLPVIETLFDGKVVMSWVTQKAGETNAKDVWMKIINPDGTTAVAETLVNDDFVSLQQSAPRIHDFQDGSFAITFDTEFVDAGGFTRQTGVIQLFNANGGKVGDNERFDRNEYATESMILQNGEGFIGVTGPLDNLTPGSVIPINVTIGAAITDVNEKTGGGTNPTPVTASIGNATVVEGGNLSFTVTLSEAAVAPITITYSSSDVTATAGLDYVPHLFGEITFTSGETSKNILITTIDDALDEPDEKITVNLTGATNGVTFTNSSAEGTIQDNDEPVPSFSISNAQVTEGDALIFFVTRATEIQQNITVFYSIKNGTATGGEDFENITTGELHFFPGEATKTISLLSLDDSIEETNESFEIELTGSSPSGAIFTTSTATGVILDNDAALTGATQGPDNLTGTSGKDTISLLGGNDQYDALGGNDTVNGDGGADTITGGAGRDGLNGGAGNDLLRGGNQNDYLTGGGGKDRLYGDKGDDSLVGGGGNDSLFGGSGNDVIWGEAGNDRILGGGGNDIVLGLDGKDRIFGNDGKDTLWSGDGADRIDGGKGNDIIDGGAGNDVLRGGAGADIINGGAGNDILYGGAGADTFSFQKNNKWFDVNLKGQNTIKDFNAALDMIDLTSNANTNKVVTDNGVDTIITVGVHSITIEGQVLLETDITFI